MSLLLRLATPSGIPQRALYWNGSYLAQVTDALIGTGKKPIVLVLGNMQERIASEGVPIVLVNGILRNLLATETLSI